VPSTPDAPPSVTVVVLSYNYGRFLEPGAESVLAQRDVDVRLLIMDDCSIDETAEVSAKLAGSDPRVTVVRNDSNRGQIPTMNDAFARVGTDYVVKLDGDDLLPPGALARATALLEAHPELAFVYGRPHHFEGAVPNLPDSPAQSWTIWPGEDWIAARCQSGANVISQPEVVMRTSFLRQAGPVREDLPHTFDMHLWLRLASLGHVGRVNGPPQGLYRVHEASFQRTIHSGFMFDLRGRRDAFDAFFEAPAREPDRERLVTARRALAAGALDLACRAYERGRTTQHPVDELVEFALDTCPEAARLPEWTALERRKAVGAIRAQRHPQFLVDAVTRKVSQGLGKRHWLRTGEL
jgi:hypothetical protein